MLKDVPSYREPEQRKIILACAALHNFIIDNGDDEDETEDQEKEQEEEGGRNYEGSYPHVAEDENMNVVRDEIANKCFNVYLHATKRIIR